MQVTEGDGYYLGRVLINAQIAAPLHINCPKKVLGWGAVQKTHSRWLTGLSRKSDVVADAMVRSVGCCHEYLFQVVFGQCCVVRGSSGGNGR